MSRDTVSLEKTLLTEREAKGKIEGRIESKIEVAKNLLAEGMSIEMVTRVTGLSAEELSLYL